MNEYTIFGSASRVSGLPLTAVVLYFLGFGATDAASQQILRNLFGIGQLS
jgi:hypothetical protein